MAAVLAGFAIVTASCDGGDDGGNASGTVSPVGDAATVAPSRTAAPSGTAAAMATIPPTAAATATPTIACVGRCPGFASQPPTPTPERGPDGVPRVPPLTALSFSAGEALTQADQYIRGYGTAGRGALNIARVQIPSIGVDAPVQAVTVGTDGVMPRPPAIDVVAFYDFGTFQGMGGLPLAGGNAIFAGDIGRPTVGPGVFAQLASVAPGEIITLVMLDGRRLYYVVEFNKTIEVASWDQSVVAATADESATFITAAGTVLPGGTSTSARRIVWARRVNCIAPASAATCELPR